MGNDSESTVVYPYSCLALYTKSGGYAGCDKPADIDLNGTKPFSITAWIYIESVSEEQLILSQNGGVFFSVRDGRLRLRWNEDASGGEAEETSETAAKSEPLNSGSDRIETGIWNYVAAVYDGSNIRYYCNGRMLMSEAYSGSGNGTGKLYAGKDFFGYLRFVTLYGSALSAEDVAKGTYSKDGAVMCIDFTSNPPMETVSGKEIDLLDGATIVRQEYGAVFQNNGYLDLTDDYYVNPCGYVGAPYSVQAWVYPRMDDETNIMTVFTNTDPSNSAGMRLTLERKSDGLHLCLTHGLFELEENKVISDATVPNLQWTNIAVVYHDTVGAIYINGRLHHEEPDLLPMLKNLEKRRCFIGSDLDSGSENGVNVFTGCISRLEVWSRELSNAEILKYMDAEPQYDEELMGQWLFCQGNYVNTVSFEPAARRRGLEIGIGHEGHIFDTVSERPAIESFAETEDKYRNIEIPLSCRQEAVRSYMDSSGLTGSDVPDGFYMVNHFKENGNIYIVIHEKTSSHIVMDMDVNDADDKTLWMVELVLIIIGGVINLFCGASFIGGDSAKAFITTFIVRNPIFFAVAAGFTSVASVPQVICRFMKELWDANVLRTLLKLCFHFSFFTILQVISSIVMKIIFGSAWVLVQLAVLAASIMVHMSKYPDKENRPSEITVKEVLFHTRNGYAGSYYIRSMKDKTDLKRAEWRSSPTIVSESILYVSDKATENVPNVINVWTAFNLQYITEPVVFFRCRDLSLPTLLGDSETIGFQILGMINPLQKIHFQFPNHHINDNPIRRIDLHLRWEYSFDQVNWGFCGETNTVAYLCLRQPGGPWLGRPVYREFLDASFDVVNNIDDVDQVAARITGWINGFPKFRYDDVNGASRYAVAINGVDLLQLDLMIQDITAADDLIRIVNCVDCACMVLLFADVWGCNLIYREIYNINPQNIFGCNEIIAIGFNNWAVPFGRGFSFHALAVQAGGNANNLIDIYDACLKVNNDPVPWGANKIPVNPQGMAFSQEPGFPPVNQTPVAANSYREHLCTNAADGAHVCMMGILFVNPMIF